MPPTLVLRNGIPRMNSAKQPVICLILVGGLGTRLRPLISDLPKPMAPIGGKPFLEYLVLWVGHSGFHRVVLCTGYSAERIEEYFGRGDGFGVDIAYSVESKPLGTWGAIRQAMDCFPGDHFLVLNGDSFLQVELQALLDFHLRKQGLATIAVLGVPDSSRFGSIRLFPDGHITEFSEKVTDGPALINGGIYCLSREILDVAPEAAVSLEKEVFPAVISHGVYGMTVQGYFVDIGIPEEYLRLAGDAENWMKKFTLPLREGRKC
jgi:D-glycero-alpha-D-manno-heptose 1-phosphate guanylyltransferase